MRGALLFALLLGLLGGCRNTTVAPEVETVVDDPRLSQAALLAAACSGCHASGSKTLVGLESYDAAALQTRLLAYQQTPVGPSAMHRMATGYTPAEIRLIADYLAGAR